MDHHVRLDGGAVEQKTSSSVSSRFPPLPSSKWRVRTRALVGLAGERGA